MSLTRELKVNKQLLKIILDNNSQEYDKELLSRSKNKYKLQTKSDYLRISSIVGTSYDYMLRFEMLKIHSDKKNLFEDYKNKLVSNSGFFNLISKNFGNEKITSIYGNSIDIIEKYINKEKIKINSYFESLIILSLFEQNYRSGSNEINDVINTSDYKKYINKEYIYVIKDLDGLFKGLEKNKLIDFLNQNKEIYLNPFFSNSKNLNGADADLLTENTLIDIKTIQDCTLKEDMLTQLIGYYILAINDGLEIKTISIYFSRYDYLLKIDINDIMDFENINAIDEKFRKDYKFKVFDKKSFDKNAYKINNKIISKINNNVIKDKKTKKKENRFEFTSY